MVRTARGKAEAYSPTSLSEKLTYEQSGETMVYVVKGDSGQPVYRTFLRGLRVSYPGDDCSGA